MLIFTVGYKSGVKTWNKVISHNRTDDFKVNICALILLACTWLSSADIITIDAYDNGWYSEQGTHDPDIKNTFTGLDNDGTVKFNSFFLFHLSDIPFDHIINSAILNLELASYFGPDDYEYFTLFDISTEPSELQLYHLYESDIYDDLQTGAIFGSGVASAADVGNILSVTLSEAALQQITNDMDRVFAVGLHVTEPFTNGYGVGDEGIMFNRSDEPRIHQLVINTENVPEPSIAFLFCFGLLSVIIIKKRRVS